MAQTFSKMSRHQWTTYQRHVLHIARQHFGLDYEQLTTVFKALVGHQFSGRNLDGPYLHDEHQNRFKGGKSTMWSDEIDRPNNDYNQVQQAERAQAFAAIQGVMVTLNIPGGAQAIPLPPVQVAPLPSMTTVPAAGPSAAPLLSTVTAVGGQPSVTTNFANPHTASLNGTIIAGAIASATPSIAPQAGKTLPLVTATAAPATTATSRHSTNSSRAPRKTPSQRPPTTAGKAPRKTPSLPPSAMATGSKKRKSRLGDSDDIGDALGLSRPKKLARSTPSSGRRLRSRNSSLAPPKYAEVDDDEDMADGEGAAQDQLRAPASPVQPRKTTTIASSMLPATSSSVFRPITAFGRATPRNITFLDQIIDTIGNRNMSTMSQKKSRIDRSLQGLNAEQYELVEENFWFLVDREQPNGLYRRYWADTNSRDLLVDATSCCSVAYQRHERDEGFKSTHEGILLRVINAINKFIDEDEDRFRKSLLERERMAQAENSEQEDGQVADGTGEQLMPPATKEAVHEENVDTTATQELKETFENAEGPQPEQTDVEMAEPDTTVTFDPRGTPWERLI